MKAIRPHFAPWDERETPRILSDAEVARRIAVFAEIERHLASALDSFAEGLDDGHLKSTARKHVRNHRWHVQLWEQLGADSNAQVGPEVEAVLAGLGGDTVELLTSVYRVPLPRMVTAYTYFQRAIGSASEDEIRWIELMLKDLFDSVRDGELALQSLLASADDAERSATRRAALESHLVKAGGIAGPNSIGMEVALS